MVFIDLILRIVSENIQMLKVCPYQFNWCFKIECTYCKLIQPNDINFTCSDQHEMKKGHGITNFTMNCKECKKGINITVHSKSQFSIICENGDDEGVLATFECRGCEIKKWIPKDGISLKSDSNFSDVDITDNWMEYDESTGLCCSLLEPVEWRLEKNKNL